MPTLTSLWITILPLTEVVEMALQIGVGHLTILYLFPGAVGEHHFLKFFADTAKVNLLFLNPIMITASFLGSTMSNLSGLALQYFLFRQTSTRMSRIV